jgi:hypothetical protein
MPERVPEDLDWRTGTDIVDWVDPNTVNLASEGESLL